MNKKLLSVLMASALTMSASVTAFASPVERAGGVQQASQTEGPVINVKQSAFLVQVGQKFNLADSLGLEVTDATDGNITDQVKLPEVPTDKVNKFTIKIPVTNTKGQKAEKTITVNVIEIAKTVKLDKMSDLEKYDLKTLVTGNLEGLTVTATNVNNDKGTFDLKVTDGTDTITQPITAQLTAVTPKDETTGDKVEDTNKNDETAKDETNKNENNTDKQENPNAEGEKKDPAQGEAPSVSVDGTNTEAQGNLPKTGALPIGGGLGLAGTVALGAGTVYLRKRR